MKKGRCGGGGSVGTLRVLSCVHCCFINIVHFRSYRPQTPQLCVSSASLTRRLHPSTLIPSVRANKYTHNRTCAHKYCTHRAHQFTTLLLFQSNLSRLLCEVSSPPVRGRKVGFTCRAHVLFSGCTGIHSRHLRVSIRRWTAT